MKSIYLKLIMITILALAVGIPPVFAKKTGYCYITAFSMQDRVFYYTPIFPQQVKGTSYSEDEYTAEVDLIRKMESEFQEYVNQVQPSPSSDMTYSGNGAYKTQKVALNALKEEIDMYTNMGYKVVVTKDFQFSKKSNW